MMKSYLNLVEMEVRELMDSYEFPGDDTPIIMVQRLKLLKVIAYW